MAAEARAYGYGGVAVLARVAGLSRPTIYRGLVELDDGPLPGRIRRPGGGRKRLRDQQPALVPALLRLVDPSVRGDPQSALRWTSKSVRSWPPSSVGRGSP